MTDLVERLVEPGSGTDSDEGADGADEGRETKGERTRRRILELAIERFGSRGYRGTSVSEIARSAGLTQAAAYAYFDNKEALFRASVDADAGGMIDEVSALVTGTGIRELIPSLVVHAVMVLPSHPLARRILAGMEPDEVPRLVELPALSRFSDLVAGALTQAQHDGDVRSDFEPDVLAAGIESIVMGLLFTTIQSGSSATARHISGVVEAFDLMIRPPG